MHLFSGWCTVCIISITSLLSYSFMWRGGGRETYSLLDSMHNVGEQNKTCSRLIIRDVPSDNVEVRLSPLMSVPFACFQQPSSLLVPSPGGYL